MAKQEPVKPEVPVLTISAEQMAELLKVSNGKFQDFEIEMIADSNRACYYQDFRRFIYRSAKLELDPLANEIHLEYRVGREGKPQAQLFVHIDGYRRKAAESGERGGFSQALGDDAHGKYVETTLWRKDTAQPFVSRVYFTEFLTPGQMLHNKMQYHMVSKCFDEETEVLTDRGFQLFSRATGRILQVTPSGLEATDSRPFAQSYSGDMVSYESDDVNFCVTPNHDMITVQGRIEAGDLYSKARARAQFDIARSVPGGRPDCQIEDQSIILAAAYLADGSDTSGISFRIEVSKPRKIEILDNLAAHSKKGSRACAGDVAVGIGGRLIETLSDKATYTYSHSQIAPLCAPGKQVSVDVLLTLSQRQAKLLIDMLIQFDGSINNTTGVRRFYTSRPVHVSVFEIAAVIAGYSISPWTSRMTDISATPNYSATISPRASAPVCRWGRAYHKTPHATGDRRRPSLTISPNATNAVWCVTVPSGMIVVRRHGFSMLCGNCGEAHAYRMAFPFGGGDIHSFEEGQLWQARDEAAPAATTAEPAGGDYVVTEKEPAPTVAADPAPVAEVNVEESKPEPTPAATAEPTPPAEKGADVLWKESAARLKTLGLKVKAAKEFCVVYLASKEIFEPTPQDQVDAMLKAEAIIAQIGLDGFLRKLEDALQPPSEPEQSDPGPAKASSGELKLIREHFPKMPVPVQEVAADWCYEQLKTPQQLEAFLISQGADKFDAEELEIFLGITRHLAVSQAPVLTRYCDDKKISYGVFADQLSAAVWPDPDKTHVCGAPLGLPTNLVSDAFLAMVNS